MRKRVFFLVVAFVVTGYCFASGSNEAQNQGIAPVEETAMSVIPEENKGEPELQIQPDGSFKNMAPTKSWSVQDIQITDLEGLEAWKTAIESSDVPLAKGVDQKAIVFIQVNKKDGKYEYLKKDAYKVEPVDGVALKVSVNSVSTDTAFLRIVILEKSSFRVYRVTLSPPTGEAQPQGQQTPGTTQNSKEWGWL